MTPLLSIIIVSYNTKKLTDEAIGSVFQSIDSGKGFLKKSEVEVIVVDNDSKDDSVSFLKKKYDGKIKLVGNKENLGFARANNQGAAVARGEFLLLLNSDTIVYEGALDTLVQTLQDHPDFGILAASLRNTDGTYQPQGGALPNVINAAAWALWPLPGIAPLVKPYQDPQDLLGIKEEVVERGWVGGTAMLIRREKYVSLGGLDEKIFMYAEDVDLCMTIKQGGLKVGIVPGAVVVHLGNASGGSQRARLGEISGIIYVFRKHGNWLSLFFLRLVLTLGSCLRYLLFGILKQDESARELYRKAIKVSLG